jgi:hypothetical protein
VVGCFCGVALPFQGLLKQQSFEQLLSGANTMAMMLAVRGESVVLHCSDGWDRTAQVLLSLPLLITYTYFYAYAVLHSWRRWRRFW